MAQSIQCLLYKLEYMSSNPGYACKSQMRWYCSCNAREGSTTRQKDLCRLPVSQSNQLLREPQRKTPSADLQLQQTDWLGTHAYTKHIERTHTENTQKNIHIHTHTHTSTHMCAQEHHEDSLKDIYLSTCVQQCSLSSYHVQGSLPSSGDSTEWIP